MISGTIAVKKSSNLIEEKFFGKRNNETILELWHIETFEGGSASRENWLNLRALEFEKLNKGIFVLIKKVSTEELKISVEEGKKPDLISFGYGVQNYFENYLVPLNLENRKNLKETFLLSGEKNGKLLAVPYCYSRHLLFSTNEKIEKAGNNAKDGLNNLLFSSSYTYKTKKSEKIVYSCVFGGTNNPGLSVLSSKENAIFPDSEKTSSFEAYLNFMGGKASILVGNLRDLSRLENKVNNGQITSLLCEPFENKTALTQNLAVISWNSEKQVLANAFIDYCLSGASQYNVSRLGMLSPCFNIYNEPSILSKVEKLSEKIEAVKLFK